MSIKDDQIIAIRDAACECRPAPTIEAWEEHSHDCDVEVYAMCVTALEAHGEERADARGRCEEFAEEIVTQMDEKAAYWRALRSLVP